MYESKISLFVEFFFKIKVNVYNCQIHAHAHFSRFMPVEFGLIWKLLQCSIHRMPLEGSVDWGKSQILMGLLVPVHFL